MTLPREARQSLDVREGGELLFIPRGRGEWSIKVLPPRLPIAELLVRFTDEGPAPDLDRIRDAIGVDLARAYNTE